MRGHPSPNDLIVLADKNTRFALEGLFGRPAPLGVRSINAEFITYSLGDPGIRRNSVELLRGYLTSCQYALVILDWEGCGREEQQSPADLEKELQEKLEKMGGKIVVVLSSSILNSKPEYGRIRPMCPKCWDGDRIGVHCGNGSPDEDFSNLGNQNHLPPKRRWRKYYERPGRFVLRLFTKNWPKKSASNIVRIRRFVS